MAEPLEILQGSVVPSQFALPSSTAPPSATPIATPTATTTTAPTEEPTVVPTPLPLDEDDPRFGLNLSAPDYRDDFDSNLTWVGPNFEGASNITGAGVHRATDNLTDSFLWWSTTIPDIDAGNIYVEVQADVEDCHGKDAYGLAVRVEPDQRDSGYMLEFSCDGAFRVRKLYAGTIQTLQDWTVSPSIASDGSSNIMGLLATGSQLYPVANGEVLAHLEDSTFFSGNYGLYANAQETPGLTIVFDNFKLWYVSP
ncbi:MAG: hypothetical protein E4G99_02645 [Anaerolineales bacterium]|nr:MAG: hypothetical protein E4G99_02645 [Anaerolineales bacterium]